MKLKRIKCNDFSRGKDVFVSKSYVIACTGQKAILLDRQYNLVHIVSGLEYVYTAKVSPDEKYLLLLSNATKFYVVNLQTWEMQKVVIRAPYNEGLEGRGCWSADGTKIYVMPMNSNTLNSELRCYALEDLKQYQRYLSEEYCLTQIHRSVSDDNFVIIGYQRDERYEKHTHFIIHFDGVNVTEYPMEDSGKLLALYTDVDYTNRIITIYSTEECIRYNFEGKKIEEISHPKPQKRTISFSSVFENILDETDERFQFVKELCEEAGFENVETVDFINRYGYSSNKKYIYYATESGFYIANASDNKVIAEVPETYGVQNYAELEDDVVAIATWSGVKLYRLEQE